jgi:hypothetical protein
MTEWTEGQRAEIPVVPSQPEATEPFERQRRFNRWEQGLLDTFTGKVAVFHRADIIRAAVAMADEEQAELRARVADYENGITWNTTCLNCASLLDANYEMYVRADQAERRLAPVPSGHVVCSSENCGPRIPEGCTVIDPAAVGARIESLVRPGLFSPEYVVWNHARDAAADLVRGLATEAGEER